MIRVPPSAIVLKKFTLIPHAQWSVRFAVKYFLLPSQLCLLKIHPTRSKVHSCVTETEFGVTYKKTKTYANKGM